MNNMTATKTLFIISPIGPRNSDIRKHFDKVRNHIIDPVASDKGYTTLRSDNIARPGRITSQIIEHLKNDDLVVADLSRKNPNVYYELAIRHAVKKSVILIGESELDIPFDLAAQRVISYSLDPDDIINAKAQLTSQIDSVESENFIVDSPMTDTIDISSQSVSSEEQTLKRILAILESQSKESYNIQRRSRVSPYIRRAVPLTMDNDLTERQMNILEAFYTTGETMTTSDIAKYLGLQRSSVNNSLLQLMRRGIISRQSAGKGFRYSLND